MPGYMYLLVAGSMAAAAILMIFMGRWKRAKDGEYNAEALGFVGGVLNALFIVVLAFYTVITWTAADATDQHASSEAASLIEIYWQVGAAPAAERDQIRALVKEYTNEVVTREWADMDRARTTAKTNDLLIALRTEIGKLPTDSDGATNTRDQLLQNIRAVADEHRSRIQEATGDSSLLKFLLLGTIVGAISMAGYPLLIGFTASVRHVTSLVFLAAALAFSVSFAIELDHPFHGFIKVEPDAFRTALSEYSRIP